MRFVSIGEPDEEFHGALDLRAVEAICRDAFGSATRIRDCQQIAGGQLNTVYRIAFAQGAPVVLRLGPPVGAMLFRHERALLQREAAVQPLLAAACALVPALLYQDFSATTLDRPLLLLEYRSGERWDRVGERIAPNAARALWTQFGAAVRTLHELRGSVFGFPPPAQGWSSHAQWLIHLVDELVLDLAERGIAVAGLSRFGEQLRACHVQLELPQPPRLVHGDLWPRNVLVQEHEGTWRLSAILDAERAFWGEPAAEWIFGFLDLPEAFWEAYGTRLDPPRLGGDLLLRSRVYQARGALQLILECGRSGVDAGFAHENFRAASEHLYRLCE